jgi:O-antigen ligase
MIKGDSGSRYAARESRWRAVLASSALMLVGVIALLGLGVMIALLLGQRFGNLGLDAGVALIGGILTAIILVLRQDELAVMLVIGVDLYIDWYLGLHIVSLAMALGLLTIFFFARSPQHPWAEPRAIWLWVLFLALAIFPAIRGATNAYDTAFYYPGIIFGALVIFWLGTVISRDSASVRRFFNILAAFGTLLALITIIQARTGVLLFGSSRADLILATASSTSLVGGGSVLRFGSFFFDPNWNGTFFSMMIFISLGLFVEASALPKKVLYLAETMIIVPALLFTYSIGSVIAAIAGFVVFGALIGRVGPRVQIALFGIITATVLLVGFSSQINLLFERLLDPGELMLRDGAWLTAIRVIQAFPLTGVGFGFEVYQQRSSPYRVPTQPVPLAHPHDSYLELGAMGGLPVLITFVVLVLLAIWLALRNWKLADMRTRSLLCGGITAVVVLSVNSVSINGWTLPPLAAIGWLLLGVMSSPLLRKSYMSGRVK